MLFRSAGIVKGDGTSRAPVYNDLKASIGRTGDFVLTFKDYAPPTERFQYIVKVLVVQPRDPLKAPIVGLRAFQRQGILLAVSDGGNPLAADVAQQTELMIEISRYEAG